MKKNIQQYSVMTIGAALIASGLYFFLASAQLATGGVSGLSIVIRELLPTVPIGLILLMLNIIMFIIGFLVIGKSFGMKTIYCSLGISIFMMIFEYMMPVTKPVSNDMLIILIFGTLLSGAGQALIFNQGASSGGTDIIAKIMIKFIPMNIGTALQIADFVIIGAAISIFGIEKGLYGLLGIIMNGFLIDYLIDGFNVAKFVTIIATDAKQVTDYIINDLNRSATVYMAKGAYTHEAKQVITTVVNRKQFIQLKNRINTIDPSAFVTVQQLHEVMGEGFTGI